MLKDLLFIITKNLVEFPDAISIEETKRDNTVVLKLRVAPEDMGKVIGKQGRIAKAIRTVVKAAAIHNDMRVVVEIV